MNTETKKYTRQYVLTVSQEQRQLLNQIKDDLKITDKCLAFVVINLIKSTDPTIVQSFVNDYMAEKTSKKLKDKIRKLEQTLEKEKQALEEAV